jgi:hypothetical protein
MKRQMFMTLMLLIVLTAVCSTAFAEKTMQGNMDKDKPMMQNNQNGQMPMTANVTHEDLRVAMRSLWDDHVNYTRNYIMCTVGKLPDKDAVAARLMKNQEDIGNAIKPYYGDAAGMKLTAMLKDHINIAAEVVNDAMLNNKTELNKAQARWNENSEKIANFLSSANPNWTKADCMDMMNQHLAITTKEVTERLAKNYTMEIAAFDQGNKHMQMFSDFLTDGIVKQFPIMVSEK